MALKKIDPPTARTQTKLAVQAVQQTPAIPISVELAQKSLLDQRNEALFELDHIKAEIESLPVTTPEEYLIADAGRVRLQQKQKAWGDRLEKIIRPIRQGLDELYAFNREVQQPFQALVDQISRKMSNFKLEERRLQIEAERAQQAEIDRLQREAEERRLAAEQAKTPQMKKKLEVQAANLELESLKTEQEPAFVPTNGLSKVVAKKVIRVTNLGLAIKAAAAGKIPMEMFQVDMVAVNRAAKDPSTGGYPTVNSWPGFEVVDDLGIQGIGRR